MPFARKDAQSIGSACSYAKRYALSAALGITSSTEDDDGESAQPERKSGISKINEAQMELLENLGKNNPGVRANILKYWKAESFYDLKGRDVSIADITGMIKALKGE